VQDLDIEERIQDDILETGFFEADAVVSAQAKVDYLKIFNQRYLFTGKEDTAKEAAIRDFRKVYGITRVGTGVARVVKDPPEQALPPSLLKNVTPDEATQIINEDSRAGLQAAFVLPRTLEGAIASPAPGTTAAELERQALVIEAGVPTEYELVSTGTPGEYQYRFLNSEGVMAPLVTPSGKVFTYRVPTADELDDIPTVQRLRSESKQSFDHRERLIEATKLGTEPGSSQVGGPATSIQKLKEKLTATAVAKEPADPSEITRAPDVDPTGKLTLEGARGLTSSANATRGVRNHNPGNIRKTKDKWVGSDVKQKDDAFVTFSTPEFGIRALGWRR